MLNPYTMLRVIAFFFQAEDGIRDLIVTGVQTCALPISLFAGGHCLITGAPGLAKTLLVKSIAQIFHLKFQRIQFTPDLMPADITGTEILQGTEDGRRMVRSEERRVGKEGRSWWARRCEE